jgi:hypothetical protein
VPYHYVIGPDGTIYAGRSPTIAGDTNTEYDTQGHLQVMLLGNFEEQTVTTRQWDSTVQLLAHRCAPPPLDPDCVPGRGSDGPVRGTAAGGSQGGWPVTGAW